MICKERTLKLRKILIKYRKVLQAKIYNERLVNIHRIEETKKEIERLVREITEAEKV